MFVAYLFTTTRYASVPYRTSISVIIGALYTLLTSPKPENDVSNQIDDQSDNRLLSGARQIWLSKCIIFYTIACRKVKNPGPISRKLAI